MWVEVFNINPKQNMRMLSSFDSVWLGKSAKLASSTVFVKEIILKISPKTNGKEQSRS